MRVGYQWLAIGICVVAGGTSILSPGEVNQPQVDVRVTYDGETKHLLTVELENQSANPIRMTNSFLPWGSTFAMVLLATVPMDPIGPGPLIERSKVEDHPVGSEISIGPGEILRGTIDLDWQFPQFRTWMIRGDVVVFWSYVARLSDGRESKRLGGFVVVSGKAPTQATAKKS